ncbi:HIT family protein [Mycolicibacterium brisbanense]|uniref:HIT family hydrolase, diadenosine tetraphosphate hydrolase n=1 Tax=Mycolicibacterium brisbanense TaxID=146020 RepID=A0A100W325_9MYCO|nr:HIT domain-containing protein [Mycolicibacterium brisbanense]MCV7156468.1 HIT domain-containing protein [Mycolicibacterium brisbanense]GAS90713.1 HIT family hydrolase, diadenosine tetraphosphate hydrolase [Mycolicibacterium brisbanense]
MATADPDCPFCRIVREEDPNVREVYRNDQVVAFFPPEPATLGHTLVIPCNHIADIWALDQYTATHLAHASLAISRAMRTALHPDGLNLIQSNGKAATQTVFHLHVHIVPRRIRDHMGQIWPPQTHYTEDQKDATWEQLRQECDRIRDVDD